MAPRSTWKGHLKLSLVSCPVRLFNAVSRSEKVSFNLLHKDTHNRIQMKPHDPELGEVAREDLVKGYQYEKDQYVVFTDATLTAIAEREPTSDGELAQVSGVGVRKLGLYGEQVLALIGGAAVEDVLQSPSGATDSDD